MRKLILISLFIVLSSSLSVFSQEVANKTYKNAFTFNITRLALLEARFGYERKLSERNILRSTIGLQFPTSPESFRSMWSLGSIPYYYKVSKGIYLSVGYSYVISTKSHFYISPEIYFNHNSYDNKYYEFGAGTDMDSYVSLQSMDLTKSGIKFLIGKKASLNPRKKTRLEFDFFVGIGLQYRYKKLTTFGKAEGTSSSKDFIEYARMYDPPLVENMINWYPTIHGGVLLSLPF
jgi:hypothetical protein